MKATLKFAALFLAAAVPGALAAELAGAHLPASLDSLNLLSAFVATLTVLTLATDYSGARFVRTAAPVALEKSPNPLAA